MISLDSILPPGSRRYWTPDPALVSQACREAHGLTVDLCPGSYPLPYEGAKRIGWGHDGLDITRDRLPFQDQEVDFLYCRHTLEDLLDPRPVMQEIARVAKAGWIETPSVVSELTRCIDGGSPMHRGYCHHRSVFWNEGNRICVMPKYAVVEYMDFGNWNLTAALSDISKWNNVYRWSEGRMMGYQFRHEVDFDLATDSYRAMLDRALTHAQAPKNTSTAAS